MNEAEKRQKAEQLFKELNIGAEADAMVKSGKYKFMPAPKECAHCHTPIDECKGIENPMMDGLHFWKDNFYCDACLIKFGEEERDAKARDTP